MRPTNKFTLTNVNANAKEIFSGGLILKERKKKIGR
jgi:hypothetical protein